MMHFPSADELIKIEAYNQPACVTMYIAYTGDNPVTDANRIQLKNLIREAEAELIACGTTPQMIKKTLKPINNLLSDHSFWAQHHESLALFAHHRLFRHYAIPATTMPDMMTVGRGFNLQPLITAINGNEHYYLLALSHKNVRLYEGDHYQIRELHLADFPTDMKQALNIDEYPNVRETHEIAPAYMGKGSEAFHGQYNVKQTDKAMLLEFFRRIDKRLGSFLSRKRTPLIIAGVNYLLPIYRRVNTYPYLSSEHITGNLERTPSAIIREKAWHLIGQKAAHEMAS